MIKKVIATIKDYKIYNLNFRLLIYVFALTAIGIFTIGSATEGEDYQFKQIIGVILGIFVLFIFALLSYKFIFKFYWIIFTSTIALLVLVLLVGSVNKGAKRWIDLGFTQFQPSEFAKIFIIIFVAAYLYKRRERLNTFRTIFFVTILVAIPLFFILNQPDLSTSIVIFVTFCVIMFLSEIHYKIITGILIFTIPIVCVLGYFVLQPDSGILEEYQYNRLIGFYQEENEEAAAIRYQQENSLLAIGSGGLTGKGLDNSTVTSVKNGKFLSEAHTDFIFTIVGEELGFIGGFSTILLLLLIIFECFITGSRAPDMQGRLFCYGFGVLICIQSFINISVATMLLPNTGVTLPFVSYGLTSLISLYCGTGIVLNIGLQRRRTLK